MRKPKIKPAEKILSILRALSTDHTEMSLAFHIVMATEDTNLSNLSDKEFLDYLEAYQGTLSVDEKIEDEDVVEFDDVILRDIPMYERPLYFDEDED